MADRAFKIIGRWTAIALCTVAVSVAHGQPLRGHSAAAIRASHAREISRPPSRALAGQVAPAVPRAERAFVMTMDPYAHGGARIVRGPAAAPIAAPLRQVSEEARTLAREGGTAYLRAGSIRADIARYNEERGPNRPIPRGSTEQVPRPPQSPSIYRN